MLAAFDAKISGQREIWGDVFAISETDAARVQPVAAFVALDHAFAVVYSRATHTPTQQNSCKRWPRLSIDHNRQAAAAHLTMAVSFGVICLESTPLPIDSNTSGSSRWSPEVAATTSANVSPSSVVIAATREVN